MDTSLEGKGSHHCIIPSAYPLHFLFLWRFSQISDFTGGKKGEEVQSNSWIQQSCGENCQELLKGKSSRNCYGEKKVEDRVLALFFFFDNWSAMNMLRMGGWETSRHSFIFFLCVFLINFFQIITLFTPETQYTTSYRSYSTLPLTLRHFHYLQPGS